MARRIAPWLTVLLFGCTAETTVVEVAAPTGHQTTDRANITAALEKVRPGETVQFAAGTYVIGEFITVLTPGVTLQGHPDGTILRGCDPATFDDIETAQAACNGLALAGERQTARGLTFEYMWDTLWIGCCLDLRVPDAVPQRPHVGGHLIEGNTFRALVNGFRVIGDFPEPVVIRDNEFVNVWHAGGVNGRTAHVLDNRISVPDPSQVPPNGFAGLALFIQPHDVLLGEAFTCAGNVIEGNRVEGHPEAITIAIFRGDGSCHDNVIRDNTITTSRVRFSRVRWGADIVDPSDSTFVGLPITLADIADEMAEVFRSQRLPPAEANPTDVAQGGRLYGNLIEGNIISGAQGLGIEIRASSRNRIVNNEITGIVQRDPFPGNSMSFAPPGWGGANGSGIWISKDSRANEVVGNSFEDIAGPAVVIEGDGNMVETMGEGGEVRDLGRANQVRTPTDR